MTKSAIITESSGKSVEFKEEAGLFTCLLEHEVKSTKAEFDWQGPKINSQQWQELLAFFAWTYATEKSEAQARMFVHPVHGWRIWAFPQEGGTGMTTKEVDNEDTKAQRAAFGDGFVQFCTVHHHCSSPAFQSSVDLNDEKNVDGLHITIGRLDAAQFDIHCRLYVKSHRFEPNLSSFWDIGDDSRQKIEFVTSLGFEGDKLADKIARKQMCEPPAKHVIFDKQWELNYLLKPKVPAANDPGFGYPPCRPNGHATEPRGGRRRYLYPKKEITARSDSHEVLKALAEFGRGIGMTDQEFHDAILEATNGKLSEFYEKLSDECADNLVSFEELFKAYHELPDDAPETVADPDLRPTSEQIAAAYGLDGGWDGYGH